MKRGLGWGECAGERRATRNRDMTHIARGILYRTTLPRRPDAQESCGMRLSRRSIDVISKRAERFGEHSAHARIQWLERPKLALGTIGKDTS